MHFSASQKEDEPLPTDSKISVPKVNGARLLVVDDEESLRITTAAILQQEGYEVETAASGEEAVALLERSNFDLVLTDLRMERGDGLSVLSEFRRRAPLTISIVLTGFASVESAIAALQEGAYDYLVKPCDIDTMRHTIRRGVEHRRLMLAEQQARADLEQLNRDLESRIAERTAELSSLNEELAESNHVKDIFLATLSHELRTPLTPIMGWVKLLRSGKLDGKSAEQALEAIERNATLQSKLIDDLLDSSRISTGKLRFEPKPTDLNSAVEAAIETVRNLAGLGHVELEVQIFPSPLIVIGEAVRLQQIAWNLLSNAIKFTPAGGRVIVRTERVGNDARLVVEDTGIGIAPEFLPHVFDRFRQAESSTTRKYGGLGLGLSIVQALSRLHNGWVKAESEGVDRGSRFIFSLPTVAEMVVTSVPATKKKLSLKDQYILIVEDSADTRTLLSALFDHEGGTVIAVASAQEALKSVKANKPTIIISDIGMPGLDGFQLMSELRRLPGMDQVPAVAVSGYASEADRQQALDVGFAALIPKPIDPDTLFALVQQLLD